MKETPYRLAILVLVLGMLGACSADRNAGTGGSGPQAVDQVAGVAGTWRAILSSPGGELPFGLELSIGNEGLDAVMLNGEERAPFSSATLEGRLLRLEAAWYDATITAELDDDARSMRGSWQRTSEAGYVSRLPFSATRGGTDRFRPLTEVGLEPGHRESLAEVDGVWEVEFTDEDGTTPARGEFRREGDEVLGTFLTPTGDYRYLVGTYESGVLRLSTFDGTHAFLFQAKAQPDGSLVGDWWSRDVYHATWSARRVEAETRILPDSWRAVELASDDGRFRFAFDDLEGRPVEIGDPRFQGKVLLVNIFGSWCPNCNDEAPLLAEWAKRYRDRGLEVVGIAYEHTGDLERDRRQVRRFAERHGTDYTLLLGGLSDKADAGETLPDLSAVLAFPTSVFIGRDGQVARIYSGFSGPGTGEHHDRLVAEMEATLEELLDAPSSSG